MNNNQTHEMTQEAVKARFHGHKTLRGKTTPLLPDGAEREMKRLTNALMKIANEELKKRLPEIMREYARAQIGPEQLKIRIHIAGAVLDTGLRIDTVQSRQLLFLRQGTPGFG